MERLGTSPDIAVLFLTGEYIASADAIAATVQTTLDPFAFVGGTAGAVLSGEQAVEDRPGMALWAGRTTGVIAPVHIQPHPVGGASEGWTFDGIPDELAGGARSFVVIVDPFT